MITMILISSVALLVGIVGSALIWGFDALRANEIEHAPAYVDPAALPAGAAKSPAAIDQR